MKKIIGILTIATIIAFAIDSSAAAEKKLNKSGFLSSYEGLKPGPKDGADWVYFKEGVEAAKYNKVMLDQVTFFLKDDARYKGIKPEDIAELTEAFNNAARDNVGKYYPLVDKPGPDVIRIRVAITDVVPSNPGMNFVTTVLPIGLGISLIKKAATGEHTAVGETGMEMEALDSESNERIAAAVDSYEAGKLSGMSKWGSAEEAFKFWTERLRMRLDEYHGKKPR